MRNWQNFSPCRHNEICCICSTPVNRSLSVGKVNNSLIKVKLGRAIVAQHQDRGLEAIPTSADKIEKEY